MKQNELRVFFANIYGAIIQIGQRAYRVNHSSIAELFDCGLVKVAAGQEKIACLAENGKIAIVCEDLKSATFVEQVPGKFTDISGSQNKRFSFFIGQDKFAYELDHFSNRTLKISS